MADEAAKQGQTGLPLAAIEVQDLTKVYLDSRRHVRHLALDALSLSIPQGSFFGLLGPNGAGKSTFINILGGLVVKTSGTARVWGYDLDREARRVRTAIGIVPQELNLDPFFQPADLLEQQAGLYGVPRSARRTREILEMLDLLDVADAEARSLSGGMRRRLMVGKAMVHSPPVLVLDEPTAGVDVALRRDLWASLRRLNEAGVTILLTTHYIEEAEQLCSHIAILNEGKLAANDTKENLLKKLDSKKICVSLGFPLAELPPVLLGAGWKQEAPDRLVLTYRPSDQSLGQKLLTVQAYGLSIRDVTTEEADLETVFLSVLKRSEKPVTSFLDDAGL